MESIIGNVLACCGLALATYYLSTSKVPNRAVGSNESFLPIVQKIIRRRRFGAALMALISAMFLLAVNILGNVRTIDMLLFWFILLVLLLWLVVIAFLDLRSIADLKQKLRKNSSFKVRKILYPQKDGSDEETN